MGNNVKSYSTKKRTNRLSDGVDRAMALNSEAERVFALLDLIRGYNPVFDPQVQRFQHEGYLACKQDLKVIRDKIKKHLANNYYPEMNQKTYNNYGNKRNGNQSPEDNFGG